MEDVQACCQDQNVYPGKQSIMEFAKRTGSLGVKGHIDEMNLANRNVDDGETKGDSVAPSKVELQSPAPGSGKFDAWFIEGFKHHLAYIYTKEPTSQTMGNFWRMIWQEQVAIITALELEGPTVPAMFNYMPTARQKTKTVDNFTITYLRERSVNLFFITHIKLTNNKIRNNNSNTKYICHCIYKWAALNNPQARTPKLGKLVRYINDVQKKYQAKTGWSGCASGPPIVVHSLTPEISSVLIAIDISGKQLAISKRIDILNNIKQIKNQVPGALKEAAHYHKVAMTVIVLIVECGVLKRSDILPFFDNEWQNNQNDEEKDPSETLDILGR